MADFAPDTKEHKDLETFAQPLPQVVKLHDTCHFSKSLVDWYRNHQEDNEIPEGFPSCVNRKTRRRFSNFLPRSARHKRKEDSRFKTNKKRNAGLSCFVGEGEKFKDIEHPVQENKQKTQNQNSATVSTVTGLLFTNDGDSVKFKFKHFADPEDVVSDYINVHIYNRTRLGRVDKKKLFASVIALHNRKKEICTDFNDEAKPYKPLISETTIESNKRSTGVLKLEKRLPRIKIVEKAMATKNFIFEFGALDAVNKQNGSRDLEPALSVGPAFLSSKDNNRSNARLAEDNKRVSGFHRAHASISLLPKLNPSELRFLNVGNTDAKSSNGRKTVLPDIPRVKNSDRKKKESGRKQSANFDIEVAEVRSNWQLLKQNRNFTQRTDFRRSQRETRLFDTLEKMSTEIHKIKNPLLNQEANDYGIRNHEKTRAALLPEKRSSEIRNTTNLKCSIDGTEFKKVPKKSTRMGKIGNCQLNASKNEVFKNKTLLMSKEIGNDGLKSQVEKYLDKYSLTLEENVLGRNKEKEVSHPSPEIVANMLEKLNIFDVGFHINKEKGRESNNAVTSSKEPVVSRQIRVSGAGNSPPSRESESTSWDTPIRQNDEELEKLCTIEKTSGANQTDKIGIRKNNAFVEMGLNSLEGRLSKDLCSQILKSDFLKKDLSFTPARFFRTSLNFNDTLNSGRKLILNVDNHGSDSSPCNKWLQKKIRKIIARDSKVAEKPQKNVKRFGNENKNDFKKLHQIVDKQLDERKGKKKSFAQKFLKVHTDILQNPRLQAILPGLIDGIPNFASKPSR